MSDEDGTEKLKRMIYIFDSMTTKELDSDGKMLISEPSRMVRIACGSGTSVREVEELLTQHKVMSGLAKNMSGQKKNMQKANAMLQGMSWVAEIDRPLTDGRCRWQQATTTCSVAETDAVYGRSRCARRQSNATNATAHESDGHGWTRRRGHARYVKSNVPVWQHVWWRWRCRWSWSGTLN